MGGQRSAGAVGAPPGLHESSSGPPGSSWWKPHSPTFLMQREQVITERSGEPGTALRGHGAKA